ncbi:MULTISPECIES: polysaccharide pyruvyl transferase family protein [unclassified Pseudoalteromonas]|uniref:polysaccharide pyruvyl transferase family protein n=1 Tax=unclassified Pseudoalteromonas TaxID=194690 RepID=UPI0013FDFC08|nr:MULTISPECIES: polysaccharide pyruvyl transferase family protein [unclassified Pseudoalteromonas]
MTNKVVIVPACTDLNRGDQALVWEAAYLLESSLEGDTDISIVDYGNNDEDREKQSRQTKDAGFKVLRNIVENPKRISSESKVHSSKFGFFIAGLLAIADFIRHLTILFFPVDFLFKFLFPNVEHQKTFKVFKAADSIVVKGGGFLHTYGKLGDLYYLWFGLYYLLLGKRLNKKIIVLPNSIGPITGYGNRLFTKWVLNKCDLLYVRERVSLDFCNEIGIKNAKYAFDLGYYAEESFPEENNKKLIQACIEKYSTTKRNVGITVRPYRFPSSDNPGEKYEKYIKSIAKFCNENKNESMFHFIVQVQGPSAHETDLIAIKDVESRLDNNCEYSIIDLDINYKEIMTIYDKLDYLIGTRFHSVIFSQVQGIPAAAIAYGGNKTHGIMKEIGLHEYVVDINDIEYSALQAIFDNLIKNNLDYKEKLADAFEAIEMDKKSVASELRGVLER